MCSYSANPAVHDASWSGRFKPGCFKQSSLVSYDTRAYSVHGIHGVFRKTVVRLRDTIRESTVSHPAFICSLLSVFSNHLVLLNLS